MDLVKYIDLGIKDYKETWDYQQTIQDTLIQSKLTGTHDPGISCLIFVEHPHVFTLGKSGKENNLLINKAFLDSIGATFYKIDRGGDITYHGPGQLVGYPIFDLDKQGYGVKKYIFLLEESIIRLLAEFGIAAARLEGATGVWIKAQQNRINKICAMGVKISRGVTMHGFALNVNTNLDYFSYINPCGFTDKGVTSIEKETGTKADMMEVKTMLSRKIAEMFDLEIKT
jgi:lipoyl(octanoyl) transferase